LEHFAGSQVELDEQSARCQAVVNVRVKSSRRFRSKQMSPDPGLSEKTVEMRRALALEKIGTHKVAGANCMALRPKSRPRLRKHAPGPYGLKVVWRAIPQPPNGNT